MRTPSAALALALALSQGAAAALPALDFGNILNHPGLPVDVPPIDGGGELGGDTPQSSNTRWEALEEHLAQTHPELPRQAVHKVLAHLQAHPGHNMRYVAIADMDRPSNEKRLSVINLSDGSVETFLVAHGSGSGDRYAEEFSDRGRSHMTSLGLYETGEEYDGKHGRSLKLIGLEGSNDNAESRSVVLHGADYVSDEYVRVHGQTGESWGCPAVDYRDRDHIIDELGGGGLLLIYHA